MEQVCKTVLNNIKPTPIPMKPSHFADIIAAIGTDSLSLAPSPYGHNRHVVAKRLLRDRETLLRVEVYADEICAPCSHNIHGTCYNTIDTSFRPAAPKSMHKWNLLIDGRWCACLGVAQGNCMTATELCRRIKSATQHLTEIYIEFPPERILQKKLALNAGIPRFLHDNRFLPPNEYNHRRYEGTTA